jgi:hypothetical protein
MIASDFNLTPIMVEADFNQISDCLPRHAEEILSAGQLHSSLQWMRMNPLASLSLCQEGLNDGSPPQTGGKPCLLQKVRPLRVAPPQDDLHNEGSHLPARRTPPLDLAALLVMTKSLQQSMSPNSRTPTTDPYRHGSTSGSSSTIKPTRSRSSLSRIVPLSPSVVSEGVSKGALPRRGPSDVPLDKQYLLIKPSTPGVSFHNSLE